MCAARPALAREMLRLTDLATGGVRRVPQYDERMPDNIIPPIEGNLNTPGARLRLASLAPKFEAKRHQLYFDLLDRALQHADTRNVALTGAYGTGKSSVLQQLESDDRYAGRVVGLSLSTISPAEDHTSRNTDPSDSTPARTNQIQKELVKQLLYRLPPSSVPQSRFRRATVPDRKRDLLLAVIIGAALATIVILLGPLHNPFVAAFDGWWRVGIAYIVLVAAAIGISWLGVVLIRTRPSVSGSVTAPMATVTLATPSSTFFDEYLDEIVYFFQASRRDIVVIEDIDRFEEVRVFDTLRALNSLLNGSSLLGRIVFIYAIRDSVFERIGADYSPDDDLSHDTSDHAKRTLKRASRTKFFDVIIPIVPFVSADNARDLMSKAMKSSEFKIDPGLIRLAARHVADMRLIHNIRNEFEVYRNRLITTRSPIPGINDDLVFAIVLYKNTHLSDFERIRHRDSALDHLYTAWRTLVTLSLKERVDRLRDVRTTRYVDESASSRAAELGQRLRGFRDLLNSAAPPAITVTLPTHLESEIDKPETWARITAEDEATLVFSSQRLGAQTFTFDAASLARALGAPVDPNEWEAADRDALEAQVREHENAITFLRHHTWEELLASAGFQTAVDELKLTANERARITTNSATFATLVDAILKSDLARDLVRHGYLTSHFALYASIYYGEHLGPDAREYIHRCVEPGVPDAIFRLTRKDAIQLLREQGADKSDTADIFSDPSILNVSIVDFLLAERPDAARTVAEQIARSGDDKFEFLDAYMVHGQRPGELLSVLAETWDGVLAYVAGSQSIEPSRRSGILNIVLKSLAHDSYDVDEKLAEFLTTHYRELDAITAPSSRKRAEVSLGIVELSGAWLESITPLNDHARSVAVVLRLFPLNDENMRVLIPAGTVTLDGIRASKDLYSNVLARLDDYLTLVAEQPASYRTVADSASLAQLLNDLPSRELPLITRLLTLTTAEARVQKLGDVPGDAWPAIATTGRTEPTFENVEKYAESFGLDEGIAVVLRDRKITAIAGVDEVARAELAYAILSARVAVPSTLARVKTAASLRPGVLSSDRIEPEGGDLVARLLHAGLIADGPDAFSATLMRDWYTLEAAIKASRGFADFFSSALMGIDDVPRAFASAMISSPKKVAIVRTLRSDYLPSASPAQARAIAGALVTGRWRLAESTISALHAAGASKPQVVALAAQSQVTMDELKRILRLLGGDYQRVADGGGGRPHFPEDQSHERILGRLVNDTVRRVEKETFKRFGPRLVAPLM